jgi:hypothetical protein
MQGGKARILSRLNNPGPFDNPKIHRDEKIYFLTFINTSYGGIIRI